MTRRELREHCFKMLFCADFYQAEEKEEQLKQYFQAPEEDETSPEGVNEILHRVELKEADEEVLLKRAEGIMVKVPELDEKIDEVPEKVAINEAVELAKKFGGSDAPAFVNGILAKLV